jgi:hypothetical protein
MTNMDLEQREEQRAEEESRTYKDGVCDYRTGPPIPKPHPKNTEVGFKWFVMTCFRCTDVIMKIRCDWDQAEGTTHFYCQECFEWAYNRPVIP